MTDPRQRIYLDHNASAPLCDAAREALGEALEIVGNPSSVHAEGRVARARLERARRQVAALLGAGSETVVFTSGASEAASTCLVPEWLRADGSGRRFERLAVLATDHACLRSGGRFASDRVDDLPVDARGLVRREALAAWLSRHGASGLLAFAAANNETGVVQPFAEIAATARDGGAGVVLDAVQLPGRADLRGAAGCADAILLSGHKIGAPKGVGAFVLGDAAFRPRPLVTGGAQETRQRAGTEPLWAIAAFGAAAEAALRALSDADRLRVLRDELQRSLAARCPSLVVVGEGAERLPQTLAVQVPGLKAETAQIRLDLEGFAVSAGSACGSGKVGRNPVLEAQIRGGLVADPDGGLLRISFGPRTPRADLERFAEAFGRMAVRRSVDCAA